MLLGLAATGALPGCAGLDADVGSTMSRYPAPKSATQEPGQTPLRPSESDSAPSLPATTSWNPSGFDIQPDVKLRAAQIVEVIGTWAAGQQGAAAARTRVAALGLDPQLVSSDNPLLADAGAATTRVDFAQYGGLQADSASVLVVAEQWRTSPAGRIIHSGATFDVRLSSHEPRWNVTAIYPSRPKPPASSLGPQARATLTNPRLSLPSAAIADIRSGTVSEVALSALNQLAATHALAVSVLESGHPLNVFGTDRPSDHPRGRAIDIWLIDGRPVVDPANYPLVEQVMRSGIELGAYQAGGPVQLTPSSSFFSDDTHHDHVHLGFVD